MASTSNFWKWTRRGHGTTGVKARTTKEAKRKAKRKLKQEFKNRTIKIKKAMPSEKYYRFGGTKGYYTVEYETK